MTVEAMLDAALKLLKRKGVSSITTNRIAETAGVSIGSLYQYFPNKRAIFIALHERHIAQVDGIMLRRIAESAEVPLEQLISSLIDGMSKRTPRTRNCPFCYKQKCRIVPKARAISPFDFTGTSVGRSLPMLKNLAGKPILICAPFSYATWSTHSAMQSCFGEFPAHHSRESRRKCFELFWPICDADCRLRGK